MTYAATTSDHSRWRSRSPSVAFALLLLGALLAGEPALAQEATSTADAGASAAAAPSGVTPPPANFQPYVFWAYGLACALLFLFTLATAQQSKRLEQRVHHLEERLQEAHPKA